jgi:outer membrane lipoprotein SlyB
MKINRLIPALFCLGLLGACAGTGSSYRPLIDTQGVDMSRYENDLASCQAYANQVSGAAENAAVGAVAGAAMGALISAAAGSRYSRTSGARVGAVTGAAGGAATGETNQRDVIRRCLAGRGYRVLQ